MATESSAIARLVDAAQTRGMPGPDGVYEPFDQNHEQAQYPSPPHHTQRPPQKQSSGGAWWLLLVAIIVIGGAVVGGYLLAQQQGDEDGAAAAVAEIGSAAGLNADHERVDPAEIAASAVMPPIPKSAAATPPSPDASTAEDVEEELEPALGQAEIALASKTGFDILVEPKGAQVTLDGLVIGAAPLRVRNLLPGVHQIDIEGPEGFFGQHQEFELEAGEAMVLRLSLDSLGPQPANAEATDDPKVVDKTPTVKESPKRTRQARKQSKRSRKSRSKGSRAPSAKEEKDLASGSKVSLGTLMLGAKPPCDIVINGKKTGLTTPQRSIQLPEGTHRVVLVNGKHKIRKSFKVRIKAGRTTRAIQDLTKKL